MLDEREHHYTQSLRQRSHNFDFQLLIVHPFLETKTLLWEWCIARLFTDNIILFFSFYSLYNSVLSVILLKLKWNDIVNFFQTMR